MTTRTYRFPREKIVTMMKENRGKHAAIFEEAVAGYKKKAIAELEETLTEARKGRIELNIHLMPPVSHIRDYDRVIMMLELQLDNEVDLTEREFQAYVMDDWDWKRAFLTSNSYYSASAEAEVGATSYEPG